jgi:hypothetical protein
MLEASTFVILFKPGRGVKDQPHGICATAFEKELEKCEATRQNPRCASFGPGKKNRLGACPFGQPREHRLCRNPESAIDP